jgi:hypothetical protein
MSHDYIRCLYPSRLQPLNVLHELCERQVGVAGQQANDELESAGPSPGEVPQPVPVGRARGFQAEYVVTVQTGQEVPGVVRIQAFADHDLSVSLAPVAA